MTPGTDKRETWIDTIVTNADGAALPLPPSVFVLEHATVDLTFGGAPSTFGPGA